MRSTMLSLSFVLSTILLVSLTAPKAEASEGTRRQVQVSFVDENGRVRNGELDLYIAFFPGGNINVRDITAATSGHRYPILMRTGLLGKQYFMWTEGNTNQTLLCNKLGYRYGATSSVTAQFPVFGEARISNSGLMADHTGTLRASQVNPQWSDATSLSIVKCCQALPCHNDGE